jgi:CRISPR system Cascade subunit CasC
VNRTLIDIHILQTVPPSNLNRDDTGSPKTAIYGGVRRARVSSQSWKRATRVAFESALDRSDLGVRTRRIVELLADEIKSLSTELAERADELATATFAAIGIKTTHRRRMNRDRRGIWSSSAATSSRHWPSRRSRQPTPTTSPRHSKTRT